MSNKTVTIKTKKGDRQAVAYTSGVPGLVINKLAEGQGRWGITHQPSGYLVCGESLRTRADAMTVARRLAGLTDWTKPADQLGDMADLGKRVRAAVYPGVYATGPVRESVIESILPEGWELEGDDLDGLLICPCGDKIEMDGVCPQGCVSPVRKAGLI